MRVLKSVTLVLLVVLISEHRACTQERGNDNYPDRKALIINSCPHVELSGFSFANQYWRGGTRFHQEMKWRNTSKQALIAFEIVILKYDAFNRRLIGTRWTVTGRDSGDWRPLGPAESNGDGTSSLGTEEVFTAIAYVRLARLKDGTIWQVDDARLLEQLRKVASEISEPGDVRPDSKRSQTD